MTQRIFDIENEKDMADLWDILPDEAYSIKKSMGCQTWRRKGEDTGYYFEFVKINWHDKTEITRPIQEASEKDIGMLCCFWNNKGEEFFGRLGNITRNTFIMITPLYEDLEFSHCRRLTKQEIEELC